MLLALCLSLLPSHGAAAQTYNLKIKIIDELGLPLAPSTPPSFTVENCSETPPTIAATRALGEGVYELAISADGADRNCDLRITGNQYLHSAPLQTGDLHSYKDRTSSPITVNYRLRVAVKDDMGNPVNDAVVHHAGFSPVRASGGTYYFASASSGALLVERSGFVNETGKTNTQLQNVSPGTSSQATYVELSGSASCSSGNSVSAGIALICARLLPALKLTIKSPSGDTVNDATVKVYTDLARSNLADDRLLFGTADAQKTTDGSGVLTFAVPAGRYYIRAERFGYNDSNVIIDVPTDAQKTETLTLPLAGASIISPGRSQVLISPTTVEADGAAGTIITVKILDNNAAAITRRTVTVKSTRTEDTITPSSALSDSNGNAVFTITSSKAGESVYTVTAEGTTLSTFPKVTWTIPANALSSPTPSPSESKVEASISPIASSGEAAITVTVKNAGAVKLSGKKVSLSSSRGDTDTITPAEATTNTEGKASFSVKSSSAGTSVITASAENVTLNELAIITFSPAGRYKAGDLLKSEDNPAVYFYGTDGKRHAFPNEKIYKSWYADFSSVKTVSANELSGIPLGKNVTYRPGVKMIKLQTVPKVYAVAANGVLRWIKGEEAARALYGADWNKKIDDISDAFFTDYSEGGEINSSSDYNPTAETSNSPNPSL